MVAGNIDNSGLMQAGNRLEMLATDSIRNSRGGIITGRDISATAVTGDIINEEKNGVRPLFFWRSTKRGLTPVFPVFSPSPFRYSRFLAMGQRLALFRPL
jgi:hypothetical protein